MKPVVALAAVVLACRGGARHRERASEPVEQTPPVVVPADASAWTGDTIEWPAGPSADGATIGGNHPIRWATSDPKRRWVVTCEQREDTNGNGEIGDTHLEEALTESGDEPAMYLVVGSGLGRRLDALDAVSPTGDQLVIETERAVALFDTATHVAHRLPGARPLARFSGDGKRLVYLAGSEIVRRELVTGTETRVPLPAGEPVLVDLDTRGRWLVIALARGNGRGVRYLTSDWPQHEKCALGMPHLGVDTREPVEKVWIDLDHGGAVRDDQTIVRLFGDHVLAQPSFGELLLDGKRISPADCMKVQAVAVYDAPVAVLIGCITESGKSRVELIGPRHTSFAANLLPIDAISQLAPMSADREQCPVPDGESCLDLVSGVRRKIDYVWLPSGKHGDEGWYDGTRTHLLVGEPAHGPLHWRAQRTADLP